MLVDALIIVAAVTALILGVGLLVRPERRRLLAQVWRAATPIERLLLMVALLPIPGPFDEMLAVYVGQRVLRRVTAARESPADSRSSS